MTDRPGSPDARFQLALPLLGGNTAAHAEALADCRAVLDGHFARAR